MNNPSINLEQVFQTNKYIYILPLGDISLDFFEKLKKDLEKKFDFEVRLENKVEIPDYAYNKDRNQYNGKVILNELGNIGFENTEKILVITPVDLFIEDLNFIFGQAKSGGKIALISVARLDPLFYNKKQNQELFYQRVLKEATHELGHTFSLKHCENNKCVMYFSNSIEDTDFKGSDFCEECKKIYKYMSS